MHVANDHEFDTYIHNLQFFPELCYVPGNTIKTTIKERLAGVKNRRMESSCSEHVTKLTVDVVNIPVWRNDLNSPPTPSPQHHFNGNISEYRKAF